MNRRNFLTLGVRALFLGAALTVPVPELRLPTRKAKQTNHFETFDEIARQALEHFEDQLVLDQITLNRKAEQMLNGDTVQIKQRPHYAVTRTT